MNLRWLKWLAIILPALFLLLLELVRQRYLESSFTPWTGRLIAVAVMVVGVSGLQASDRLGTWRARDEERAENRVRRHDAGRTCCPKWLRGKEIDY
ncbi:MAG: hypothetical protein ACE5JJ_02260 [Nitrospinota bacterium]